MKSDDLPMYPTPQQASYTIQPQQQPPQQSQPRYQAPQQYQHPPVQSPTYSHQQYSQTYAAPPPQQYAQPQGHQLPSHSGNYLHLAPQQSHLAHPQGAYAQPPLQAHSQPLAQSHSHLHSLHSQQYSQPQYASPPTQPVSHQQHPPPLLSQSLYYAQNSHTGNGYSSSQTSQGNPNQYYAPSQGSAQQQQHYAPSPQYSAPSKSAPGSRQGSHSMQQPVQSLKPPSQPRPHKKAPLHDNRSRENLSEQKLSSKQRLEAELRATFERVDTNRSGRISARELSSALMNFDHTGFQNLTVVLMIKLFSTLGLGSGLGLNFDQFVALWKYLIAYKKLFVAADVDNSGDILFGEFQHIIEQIGYKLNVDLVLHLFQKFSRKDSSSDGASSVGKLKFDSFIELLVYLRKLTDIFKQYDKDLTGVATIDYLDFLLEISNLT